MKKTIYFHIGTPKTGTTSIQKFCDVNKETLRNFNLDYPIIGKIDSNGGNIRNILVINSTTFKFDDKEKVENFFKNNVINYINSSDCHNFLFSEEGLIFMPPDFFNFFKEFEFDLKFIIYVRPPFSLSLSIWSELTKSNRGFASEIYPENKSMNQCEKFYNKILNYIDFYGKENVIIRPFEKEQWKNGNLIDDFLSIFNINYTNDFIPVESYNVSPNMNEVEVHRLFNRFLISPEKKLYLKNLLNHKVKVIESNLKLQETISDDVINEVTQRFNPLLLKIAKAVGKDNLFINEYPSFYGKERKIPESINVTFDQLEVLHEAINEVVNEKNMLIKENEKLKSELDNQKFFKTWTDKNHKIFKIGFIKLKFKKRNPLPKITDKNFDNIISLGFNCQTAFALIAFYYGNKKIPSNFFNYVFCHKVDSIVNFLQNPKKIFSEDLEFNYKSFMFKDLFMDISYHSKIEENVDVTDEVVKMAKKEVVERMTYLKDKFFNLVKSDDKNLFILTYPDKEKNVYENIVKISECIKNLSGNKKSKILIVFENKKINKFELPVLDNVYYGFTKFHSKINKANYIDFYSWYKILRQFKIKNYPKLNLFNVIKFKFTDIKKFQD